MTTSQAIPKLEHWEYFPNGLRVLLFISDINDLKEITATLKSCNYIVTAFTRAEDAMASIQCSQQEQNMPFHAALVEATNDNVDAPDGFKILEVANDLPVILISSTEDVVTTMRAISLGAADFLHKPFSEEKLRNIWQHVARKALTETETAPDDHNQQQGDNCDEFIQSFDELVSTVEDSIACEEYSKQQDNEIQSQQFDKEFLQDFCTVDIKLELDEASLDDINLGDGIVLDGDGSSEFDLDPSIFVGLPDSDSDSALDINFELLDAGDSHDSEIDRDEALLLAEVLKAEADDRANDSIFHDQVMAESSESMSTCSRDETKPGRIKSHIGRKKMKVDWTPDLHQKFVQAVEQLGVDKAIPSRILEIMGVKGLTRHNIASHLQKYRSHRKHLLLREAEAAANWNHRRHSDASHPWPSSKSGSRRDPAVVSSWPTPIQPRTHHTPILPAPSHHHHHHHHHPANGVPVMVWGHPTTLEPHLWQQQPPPAAWHAPDGTMWQHPATCIAPWAQAPAPGTPVYPQKSMKVQITSSMTLFPPAAGEEKNLDTHPPREVVNAVISEAFTNPCTLPLGLKPPSMESVMSELLRQGINISPPLST